MSDENIFQRIVWSIIASPFFSRLRTRVCHTQYYVVNGNTKGNGHLLRSLVFGSNQFLHYIMDLVCREGYQIENTGNTTLHNAISVAERVEPDVAFAEFHGIFSDAMSEHFQVLPDLNWDLDLAAPLEILISKMKRVRRRCIREIEEKRYAYEFTKDPKKLHLFYDMMYVPYISSTHGHSARIVSMALAEKTFHKGGLFLVRFEDEYVSGILFSKVKNTIKCALLAVDPRNGREVAGQAALHGLIKWAKEKGFTEIDYGRGAPFASDGLFEYKRTWGMQVRATPDRAFGIRIRTLTNGALDFLASNPLLFRCPSELAILVMLGSRDVDAKALYRRYYTSGLAYLIAIHPMSSNHNRGMSPPNSVLKQSMATLLPMKELSAKNYCLHTLRFSQST